MIERYCKNFEISFSQIYMLSPDLNLARKLNLDFTSFEVVYDQKVLT